MQRCVADLHRRGSTAYNGFRAYAQNYLARVARLGGKNYRPYVKIGHMMGMDWVE